jgi:putative peptide zinc metalloprotease protein
MGVGLYLVWPVFYTDVTDAYRLSKGGRVRTDLGGVYFNALFILATAAAYFWTHFELLLVVIAIEHATILQQLAPWLRLDGYYVITDLTGVPDILSRVRPVLRSLLPGAAPQRRVQELKPWVRAVVTVYVLLLVPVMAFFYALLAIGAPRFFVAAMHALHAQLANAAEAWQAHHAGALALAAVQLLGIALPVVGTALVLGMLAHRILGLLWQRGRARARGIVVFAAGAAAAALAIAWWNGAESRPALGRSTTEPPALWRARRLPVPTPPAPIRRSEARLVGLPPATSIRPFSAAPRSHAVRPAKRATPSAAPAPTHDSDSVVETVTAPPPLETTDTTSTTTETTTETTTSPSTTTTDTVETTTTTP